MNTFNSPSKKMSSVSKNQKTLKCSLVSKKMKERIIILFQNIH